MVCYILSFRLVKTQMKRKRQLPKRVLVMLLERPAAWRRSGEARRRTWSVRRPGRYKLRSKPVLNSPRWRGRMRQRRKDQGAKQSVLHRKWKSRLRRSRLVLQLHPKLEPRPQHSRRLQRNQRWADDDLRGPKLEDKYSTVNMSSSRARVRVLTTLRRRRPTLWLSGISSTETDLELWGQRKSQR